MGVSGSKKNSISRKICLETFPKAANTGTKNITLFVGTWNMGNAVPDELNLAEFLEPNKADVYLIGSQECYSEPRKGCCTRPNHWFGMVTRTLGDEYVLVKSGSMYDQRIIVMARKSIFKTISSVNLDAEATGICGVTPNKGACAISFSVCNTSFCFVSSHLAAHQGKVQDREEDFREITRNIQVGIPGKPLTQQFNHVIWVGDLNYRIDDIAPDKCVELINASEWGELYKNDQLNKQRTDGKVFYLFKEGELNFPPTYKHIAGSEGKPEENGRRPYQTVLKGGKLRCPSWTDRIQWKSFPNESIELIPDSYESCPQLFTSDHSPVRARLSCNVTMPCESNKTAQIGSVKIEISNLKGHNLKASDRTSAFCEADSSDPYCVFSAEIVNKVVTTETIAQSLNPEWEGTYVLEGREGIGSAQWVERYAHVLVSAMDKDTLSADDNIGHGVISCRGALEGTEFTTNLTWDGQSAGTLTGNVKITMADWLLNEQTALADPLKTVPSDNTTVEDMAQNQSLPDTEPAQNEEAMLLGPPDEAMNETTAVRQDVKDSFVGPPATEGEIEKPSGLLDEANEELDSEVLDVSITRDAA